MPSIVNRNTVLDDHRWYVCSEISSSIRTTTGISHRGLVLVFPHVASEEYTLFAQTAAATGFQVAVIPTELASASPCPVSLLNNANTPISTSKCYQMRLMRLMGHTNVNSARFPGAIMKVSQNSIMGRINNLLTYLSKTQYGKQSLQYVDKNGAVAWGDMCAVGHGEGAQSFFR